MTNKIDYELLSSLLTKSHSNEYTNITKVIIDFLKKNTTANILLQKIKSHRTQKQKANIIAIFGKCTNATLINCHLDTVAPVKNWSFQPYALTRKNNKLYGLGIADTKANIYAVLKALEYKQPDNLLLLFSVDEETNFRSGVYKFIHSKLGHHIKKSIYRAIVCEPTNLKPVHKHPGYINAEFRICSNIGTTHSSQLKPKINAIVKAATLISKLDSYGFNIGKICGGFSHNIIANECKFNATVRTYASHEKIHKKIINLIERTKLSGISFKITYYAPPLNGIHTRVFNDVYTILNNKPTEENFWSEASLFEQAGIPAIVIGAGNIKQAHTHNEYIFTRQITKIEIFFKKLINKGAK